MEILKEMRVSLIDYLINYGFSKCGQQGFSITICAVREPYNIARLISFTVLFPQEQSEAKGFLWFRTMSNSTTQSWCVRVVYCIITFHHTLHFLIHLRSSSPLGDGKCSTAIFDKVTVLQTVEETQRDTNACGQNVKNMIVLNNPIMLLSNILVKLC